MENRRSAPTRCSGRASAPRNYKRVYAGTSGRVWKVFYRQDGKLRSKTCDTLKAAKVTKAQIETKLAEGKKVDPLPGKMKYEDFVEQYRRQGMADLSPKARGNYDYVLRTHLLPFFGGVQLNSIDRQLVADWVEWARPNWSPWTVKEAFATLRASLGFAVRTGRLDSNPVARCGDLLPKLPKRRRKVLLSPGEVLQLANAVKSRHKALVLLMAVHGLRPGEVLALTVGDVHLADEHPFVEVTKAVTEAGGRMILNGETKTGEDREVELFSFVAEALYEHLATHVVDNLTDDALLFPQERGKSYMHESFLRGGFAYVWKPGAQGKKVRTQAKRPTGIIVPAASAIGRPG